jgi:tetratricopeptide (TPR) repeat protein
MQKLIFALAVLCLPAALALAQSSPSASQEADRLFSHGEDAERDRRALDLLERALAADANNYQLLWRAAKVSYHLGDRPDAGNKLRYFERGIGAGERAVAAQPQGVEGHFWLGANLGGYSDAKGWFTALRTVRKVRAEMETVLRLQPGYDRASAYLALGEIDRQLPRLFGGSLRRAISYFEQGLRLAPRNLDLKFALARAYLDAGRRAEARRQLEEILAPGIDQDVSGDRRTQERARQLLAKL